MSMAKKGAAAVEPVAETTAPVENLPAVQEAAAVPAVFVPKKRTKPVEIDVKDITIPQIKIGQGTSEEVKAGLVQEGDLFLNTSGEVLAKKGQPLRVVVLDKSKEIILWRDRKDGGGGIMARANKERGSRRYAWDKPGETFRTKVNGLVAVEWKTNRYVTDKKGDQDDPLLPDEDNLNAWGSQIPGNADSGKAATEHFNYVVALPDHGNFVAAFSLSRSGVKPAKAFNSLLDLSDTETFHRFFTVVTHPQTNSENQQFQNVRFRPAGNVTTQEEGDLYEALASRFGKIDYRVDQTGGDGGVDEGKSNDGKF